MVSYPYPYILFMRLLHRWLSPPVAISAFSLRTAFSTTPGNYPSASIPTLALQISKEAAGMSDSRDRMIREIADGGGETNNAPPSSSPPDDASNKLILSRGCDPQMASRATSMLPPLLGGARFHAVTDDNEFFRKLKENKYDLILFAPGMCRFSAAKQRVPGSIEGETSAWSMEEYAERVRELQGDDVKIVSTTEERQIVPLCRRALGLS
mmetsp:Transcript_26040/g.62530  ORF Transcript_26040/g.62530 Transcript_26040/m.62530 type:complete len:210 (-) Transcript_26040:237-866(-)